MNEETFKNELAKLETEYGKVYKAERKKLLFQEFKHLPDYWMESVVRDFIRDERYAPLAPMFREKATEYLGKKELGFVLPAGQRAEQKSTECRDCAGSGLTTREDKNGYRFLMKCSCSEGLSGQKTLFGPTHSDGNRDEVAIPRFHDSPVSKGIF